MSARFIFDNGVPRIDHDYHTQERLHQAAIDAAMVRYITRKVTWFVSGKPAIWIGFDANEKVIL